MASRGIIVTCESVRQWTLIFGQRYANELRWSQALRHRKRHLDEIVLTIKGKHHYLWRAVDRDVLAPGALVQKRRNRQAATRFFCKLLKALRFAPHVLSTNKLKSYAAAKVLIMSDVAPRQQRGLITEPSSHISPRDSENGRYGASNS